MDRPELRKELEKLKYFWVADVIDQLRALLPDEEAIRKQIEDEWLRKTDQEKTRDNFTQQIIERAYAQGKREERERIEYMFADNEGMITFIRKRDGKAGVENCKLIIVTEWQALDKG